MSGIKQFIAPLSTKLTDGRNKKNLEELVQRISANGTTKLAALGDAAETRQFTRLLQNEKLSIDLINQSLLQKADINEEKRLFAIIDATNIRKPFTEKSDDIDRVLDLKKTTVNGYNNLTAILIEQEKQQNVRELHVISTNTYSTKSEDFLSKNVVFENLIDQINKLKNPITCIMDREYDNKANLCYIHSKNIQFLVRVSKLKRNVFHKGFSIKVDEIDDYNHERHQIEFLQIKKTKYRNLTLDLYYTEVEMPDSNGEILKTSLIKAVLSQKGKPLYKQPLYLYTSHLNLDFKSAFELYLNYFLRWKIEVVFKFVKDTLGLEEFRIQNLKAIIKLVAITFLVGAYYFAIGNTGISEEFLIMLSNLGGGRGKIKGEKHSIHYVRLGLQKLLAFQEIKRFIHENEISDDEVTELMSVAGDNIW
jgi:hypothetical protein